MEATVGVRETRKVFRGSSLVRKRKASLDSTLGGSPVMGMLKEVLDAVDNLNELAGSLLVMKWYASLGELLASPVE